MSRQLLSRAAQFFLGAGSYAPYESGKYGTPFSPLYVHDFGAPAAAVANGVCASQSVTGGVAAVIAGSLASGGVATFDIPRNVVAAWTTASVITVTGTDVYGQTMIESSASGTSFAGKKAFKTVTAVSFSVSVTLATVGSGDVLGLPFRADVNGLLSARAANAIDAGTFVPADTTSPATATTGDVRGTFDPAIALNASNKVKVAFDIADRSSKIGSFGVTQYGS